MERVIRQWAPFCGIAGALITADASGGLAMARQIGFGVAQLVAATAVVAGARQAMAGAHPLKVAMTVTVGWFFLPIFVFGSGDLAYGSYAMVAVSVAHSYQYIFVMICLAAGDPERRPLSWLLPLACITVAYLAGYYLIILVDWGSRSRPLAVFWYSIIFWHFVIDAEVWRLGRPFKRRAPRESLPFLFG